MAIIDLEKIGRAPKRVHGKPWKKWQTVWRDENQKRRTKNFATKKEAQEHERKQLAQRDHILTGKTPPAQTQTTTLDQLHTSHMNHLRAYGGRAGDGIRPSTESDYELTYTNWIKPALGRLTLNQLTPQRITQWRDTMTNPQNQPPTPRTRTIAIKQLSRTIGYALDEGLLTKSPIPTRAGKIIGAHKPTKKKQHIYLDERQALRLMAHATITDTKTSLVITLMLTTGIRFGEAAALTTNDFNPDTGDITITKGYSEGGGRLHLQQTKSGQHRIVRVTGWVKTLLEQHTAQLPQNHLLFTSQQGTPLRLNNWRKRNFYPIVDEVRNTIANLQHELGVHEYRQGYAYYGPKTHAAHTNHINTTTAHEDLTLPTTTTGPLAARQQLAQHTINSELRIGDKDFPRLTPHDLRHTAVSIAHNKGASVKALQAIAGHASAQLTMDTYAGLFDREREEVGQALASALMPPTIHDALNQ